MSVNINPSLFRFQRPQAWGYYLTPTWQGISKSIKFKTSIIIKSSNFIQEKKDYKAFESLAQTINEIISAFYIIWTFNYEKVKQNLLKKIYDPSRYNQKIVRELIDFLWEETINLLQTPSTSLKAEYKEPSIFHDIFVDEINSENKKETQQDILFRDLQENKFYDLLVELWRKNKIYLGWNNYIDWEEVRFVEILKRKKILNKL